MNYLKDYLIHKITLLLLFITLNSFSQINQLNFNKLAWSVQTIKGVSFAPTYANAYKSLSYPFDFDYSKPNLTSLGVNGLAGAIVYQDGVFLDFSLKNNICIRDAFQNQLIINHWYSYFRVKLFFISESTLAKIHTSNLSSAHEYQRIVVSSYRREEDLDVGRLQRQQMKKIKEMALCAIQQEQKLQKQTKELKI